MNLSPVTDSNGPFLAHLDVKDKNSCIPDLVCPLGIVAVFGGLAFNLPQTCVDFPDHIENRFVNDG